MKRMSVLSAASVAVVVLAANESWACGCFASTSTVSPVIQAGERIAFATTGNKVTAYVQIRYQGDAANFGWLLPLPTVPDVKVGTDEVFEVLDETTTPSFSLTTQPNPKCRSSAPALGCASSGPIALSAGQNFATFDAGAPDPLVLRSSVGPYDYAVLKADSKDDLQAWLAANHFFVPGVTDAVLVPYIRPGAYFLALKLRAGQTSGDLRPVVLTYASDYPMIPLVLTSATAVPHMGIEVFVLGEHRAIPRNYHHVAVNLLKLNWSTADNYGALVTAAVAEAPKKQAFVTEYAGVSSISSGKLTAGGRFGTLQLLQGSMSAESFVHRLYTSGFTHRGTALLPESLMEVLEQQIPYPSKFAARGIDRQAFFANIDLYLSQNYRTQNPDDYQGWPGVTFDAATLSDLVWKEQAEPIMQAEAMLLDHPYLTRMVTTLSPEDMTEDPVFGVNSTLPTVPLAHAAIQVTACGSDPGSFAEGGVVTSPDAVTQVKKDAMPAAARVEILRDEGAPEVVSDFKPEALAPTSPQCSMGDGPLMVGLAGVWVLLRNRRWARQAK